MGWHCITVWECELKPSKREATLDSIAFTLNHIWLQDHRSLTPDPSPRGEGNYYGEGSNYQLPEEEDTQMPMAAEDVPRQ